MNTATPLKPIPVEELRKAMADKTAGQTEYAAFFKWIMLKVSEVYLPKVSPKFLDAVEVWAKDLGGHRHLYTPNQPNKEPVSDDSEAYCYKLWMELDGSQNEAAIRARGQDPVHQLIIENAKIPWNGLKPDEQKALRYATLRICMMRPSDGGFGNDGRWKGVPTGSIPRLLTESWEKGKTSYTGRSEVFLQDARTLAQDYETKRNAAYKTDPRDPFGDLAKQKKIPAPKPKGGEQTNAKAGEVAPSGPANRQAIETDEPDAIEEDEPASVNTVLQFPLKQFGNGMKGPTK